MTDRELSRDQTDATVKAVRGHPDPVGGRRAGSPAHTRKRHIETQLAGELRLGRAGCPPHRGNRLPRDGDCVTSAHATRQSAEMTW